jgi:TBCC domain-containing protein 1
VRAVASLRGALRDARLDEHTKRELQATIQAHFKEWLLASGSMRQVYELARIERGESAL